MSRLSKKQKSKSTVVSGDLLPPEPAATLSATDTEPSLPVKEHGAAASKENHEPTLLAHAADTPKEAALPLLINNGLQTLTRSHETVALPESGLQSPEDPPPVKVDALMENSLHIGDVASEKEVLTVSSAPPHLHAGEMLKKAREAAGLSIDEVSRSLKLAPRQVLALEQQDFTALPARAFVRGFMRNYARLLNIDADAVLAVLPSEAPQEISLAASSVENPTQATPALPYGEEPSLLRSQLWKWLLVTVILVLCATVFFLQPQIALLIDRGDAPSPGVSDTASSAATDGIMPPLNEGKSEDNDNVRIVLPIIAALPDTPSPVTQPVVPETASAFASTSPPTTAAPRESAASSTADLTLRLTGESWIEVRDGHNKIIYAALAKAGSEKALHGTPPFSLTLGNSSAVSLDFRGENIDLSAYDKQGVARFTLE